MKKKIFLAIAIVTLFAIAFIVESAYLLLVSIASFSYYLVFVLPKRELK